VFKALQGQFVHDLDEGLWKLAGPTEALLRDVQAAFARLNRSVFVRSLDAVHLVTARAEGFERIYSNDRHLLAAARSFGLGCGPDIGLTRRAGARRRLTSGRALRLLRSSRAPCDRRRRIRFDRYEQGARRVGELAKDDDVSVVRQGSRGTQGFERVSDHDRGGSIPCFARTPDRSRLTGIDACGTHRRVRAGQHGRTGSARAATSGQYGSIAVCPS
jgi:hypothetical protein